MTKPKKKTNDDKSLTLLTGATGFIGSRLARRLAEQGQHLALLCRPGSAEALEQKIQDWPPQAPPPKILLGDLDQPKLGLTEQDRRELTDTCGKVFHLAARYDLRLDDQAMRAINVDGTARVLELAADCAQQPRVHHMSSIAVSGDAGSVYAETDFDVGQQALHAYGQTKFDAEALVRQSGLPCSIYRAGVVVGDSKTGEMDKVDGPYYVFRALRLIRRIPGASRLPMIIPRDDDDLFHLVPVDYVVDAMAYLADLPKLDPLACWHLCDPNPASFRQFYSAALDAYDLQGPRIGRPVQRLFRLLCKPGPFAFVKQVGDMLDMPAEMLRHMLLDVRYDTQATEEALAESEIHCPPLLPLVPLLVDYFESHMK